MKRSISEWMSIKGITKERLAADASVCVPTICNWIKHPERITFEKGKRVADALGVDITDIIFMP